VALSETLVRRIALDASADTRTVRKLLAGKPVRGIVRDRIVRACAARGVPVPGPATLAPRPAAEAQE
jgi:hypothetical protein